MKCGFPIRSVVQMSDFLDKHTKKDLDEFKGFAIPIELSEEQIKEIDNHDEGFLNRMIQAKIGEEKDEFRQKQDKAVEKLMKGIPKKYWSLFEVHVEDMDDYSPWVEKDGVYTKEKSYRMWVEPMKQSPKSAHGLEEKPFPEKWSFNWVDLPKNTYTIIFCPVWDKNKPYDKGPILDKLYIQFDKTVYSLDLGDQRWGLNFDNIPLREITYCHDHQCSAFRVKVPHGSTKVRFIFGTDIRVDFK